MNRPGLESGEKDVESNHRGGDAFLREKPQFLLIRVILREWNPRPQIKDNRPRTKEKCVLSKNHKKILNGF